jgi:hypothetical protein
VHGRERSFPLLPWLIGPTILLCVFLVRFQKRVAVPSGKDGASQSD